MAKLDWGETQGETIHMLKATVQTHENVLFGSTEEKIEGVAPTVTMMMTKFGSYKDLAILLNAIILLLVALIGLRAELRPPIVIYQQGPMPSTGQQQQPVPPHKGYNERPQVRMEQPQPQDAGNSDAYSNATQPH